MRSLVSERGLGQAIEIDSAGTAAYHAGERADARSRAAAKRRGIALDSIARQVVADDFRTFDYLLAMDGSNLTALIGMAPPDGRASVHLLRDFDPNAGRGADVPDPYYGGEDGFDTVLDMCEAACLGFLDHVVAHHDLAR